LLVIHVISLLKITDFSISLQIPIEQNRCAMACQGCGAVFLFSKKAVTGLSQDSIV